MHRDGNGGQARPLNAEVTWHGAAALGCLFLLAAIGLTIGCGGDDVPDRPLSRALLDESLRQGRRFLVNVQQPEGNFYYQVDLVTGKVGKDDNEVRQAGTLWAVSLLHQDEPGDDTRNRRALLRGIAFFDQNGRTTDDGRKYVTYPTSKRGSTGTVALVTLSLIELLRTEPDCPEAEQLRSDVDQYIEFLLSLRRDDGHFHGWYSHQTGKGTGRSSPYYDGETLLALSRAANYLGRDDLEPLIIESAGAMYQAYFVTPRKEDDVKLFKQFYQWGSMAFLEIYQFDEAAGRKYAPRAVKMAHWLIDQMPRRITYNASYAYEGLISAWELARQSGDKESQAKIGRQIRKGMLLPMTYQVEGPMPNKYLQKHSPPPEMAIGGAMNGPDKPELRIDVTQHQMHSVILARRYIYRE